METDTFQVIKIGGADVTVACTPRDIYRIKSLPYEQQMVSRAELADSAAPGDIFRRNDGRIIQLESRSPDGNWEADMLEDAEGFPDPEGQPGCHFLLITAEDLVGYEMLVVAKDIVPPRSPVGGIMAGVDQAIFDLSTLRPWLLDDHAARIQSIQTELARVPEMRRRNQITKMISVVEQAIWDLGDLCVFGVDSTSSHQRQTPDEPRVARIRAIRTALNEALGGVTWKLPPDVDTAQGR